MTERAAWFENFAAVIAEIGLTLGLTQEQIDQIQTDNVMVRFLVNTMIVTSNYERSVRSFQRSLLFGKKGSKPLVFPAAPADPVPSIPETGVFERLERTVRFIRVQPAYTSATGARLGIIPQKARRVSLASYIPPIEVSADSSGYTMTVRTVRREFDAYVVECKREGADKWESHGLFRPKAKITVTPLEPGRAEMLQVRLRMVMENEPVGNYSNVQRVILAP
jgi:hypothetical protein